jgi:hypothetical protein
VTPHKRSPEGRSFDTPFWITLRWTRGTRYYRVHLDVRIASTKFLPIDFVASHKM